MGKRVAIDNSKPLKRVKEGSVIEFEAKEYYHIPKLLWMLDNGELDLATQERYKNLLLTLNYEDSFPIGYVTVKYTYGELNFGRLIPSTLSYILMSRKMRQTISNNMYYDLDMVNCHPTIFLNLVPEPDFESPEYKVLERYVNQRDTVLEEAYQTNHALVSKANIKTWFLKILNGGDGIDDLVQNSFMLEYMNAVPKLQKKVFDHYKEDERYKHLMEYICKKGKSTDHEKMVSFNAHVLYDIEDQLRKCIVESLKQQGFDTSVMCYDGVMMYINLCKTGISSLDHTKIAAFMIERLGFSVDVAFKSMTDEAIGITEQQLVTYSKEYFISLLSNHSSAYDAVKRRFEKNNFFSASTVTYYTQFQDVTHSYPRNEFIAKYEDLLYTGVDKKGNPTELQFIHEWLKDPNKRKYQSVGLYPPGFHENTSINLTDPEHWAYTYSLWTGLRAEAIVPDGQNHEDAVELFRNHTLYLCSGKTEFRDYLERILKHIFVYPGRKTDVAIAFKALQGGEGKNTWWEIVSEIIGKQYCFSTSNLERDIFGDFNEGIKNKIWVHLEEVNKQVLVKHQKLFLSYITSVNDIINLKGGKKASMYSFCNYFMSFNTQGVELFPGLHRRLWVHEMESQIKGPAYYDQLYTMMKNPQKIRAIYDWIMTNVDITTFQPKDATVRPMTEYMSKLWGRSDGPKDRLEQWLKDWLLEQWNNNINPVLVRYQVLELHNNFKNVCDSKLYIPTIQAFSHRIQDFFAERDAVKKTMSKGTTWLSFDLDQCVETIVNKNWLNWIDLGYYDTYVINGKDVLYKCSRPPKKACTNTLCRMWKDETRALQYYQKHHSLETAKSFECTCGGFYEISVNVNN